MPLGNTVGKGFFSVHKYVDVCQLYIVVGLNHLCRLALGNAGQLR